VGIEIWEEALPINEGVSVAAEILGLDPLYMANEGKLIALLPQSQAEAVLTVIRETPYGRKAALIGQVKTEHPGKVVMQTLIGGKRLLDMLSGEQLPRIC
jgi:hydrogenase expression/formation protein HypE